MLPEPDSYCAIHPEACHTFFGSYSHGQCIDEPEEPFFSCDCDESTGWYNFADNMCLITDECRLWIDDCPWGCSNIFLDREDSSYRCSCPYGTAGDGYNCHGLGNTQMYILEFPVVINENPYDEFLFNEHLKANITRSMLATFGVYGMTSATVIHRSKLANSPAEYLIQAALFFNQALPFGEEKPLKLILETELSHIQFHDEIEPLNVYPGGVFYTTSPALVHIDDMMDVNPCYGNIIDDMMDVNPCYGNIFQQVCPEPVKQLCVHTDGSSGSFSCRCRENYVIESASDDNGNEVCGTCVEGYDPNSNCVCWTAARLDQECSAVCGTGRCIRHCESVECECKHGTVLYTEPGTGVQRCADNTDYCTTHPEACHEFPGTYDHGECLPISEVPFYECDCDEATGWYNDGPRLCALGPNVLECTTTEQANCGAENLCYRANATTPGQCVCRRGQRRNSVGNRCEVDNPCESTGYNHPCIGSWTTCEFNAANREVTCGCIDGYESDGNLFHPCHAINPCDSNPCLGGSLCVYMAPGQYECQCQGIFQNLNDNGGPVVCEAVSPCSNEIISKSCVDKNMICRDLPYTENVPEIGTNAMDYYECVCKPPRFFDPVTMLCTSLGSDGTEELSLFEMTIPLVLTGDPLNDDLAKVQLEKDIQEAMFEAFGQFGLRESALISVGLWTIDQQERKEELEVYHYAVQDIDYSVDVALYLNEALLPNTGGSPLVDILKTSLGQFDLEDGHSYYLMPGGKLRIPSIAVNDISAFTGIDPCGRDDICEFTEIWECVHNASQSGSFRCVCKSGYESIGLNGGEEQCRDINECLNTRICENLWGDHGANSTICFNQPGKYSCVCSNGYYVNQEGKCEHVPGVTLGTTEQSPNTSDGTGSPPTAESTTGIPSTTEDPGDVASTLCSNCLVIFSVFLAQFLFQFAN
ncbi:unnamed protein product [Cyprideis torosa]|uniref:Uncharacterized protein n=1 Tax=Cyprideis torosa TaxID=163714 RepID=A0A7R8W8T8_9CRUS|nr:unnamed protein product [Cyprideis torosa]CAG0888973.1 unnamed protein product [Cyprideis torosa]